MIMRFKRVIIAVLRSLTLQVSTQAADVITPGIVCHFHA